MSQQTIKESHKRSILKSILWRLLGVLVLAIVTYAFTRSLIQTGLITFIHHFAFIFIYYFHERAWLRVNRVQGKTRRILRAFTYEIILGHFVLGLITFTITGSWLTVSLVTIVYIENKLWIYAVYDHAWSKIKWATTT